MSIQKEMSKHMSKTARPFVKWAGGKNQLLNEIRKKYPDNINKYCEPFVGRGAVLFDILNTFHCDEILINDINADLISTYRQIQNNVENLIDCLKSYQDIFLTADIQQRKLIFSQKRERFNSLKSHLTAENELERASLFIFLNKTCFNGLYRVNRKGMFNVPMGAYKNPVICDCDNLRSVNIALQNVIIRCGDYHQCYDFIDSDTFVYIDPPYRPLTLTASFTSYSENGFNDEEQILLEKFVQSLSEKEASVLISNSDPKNTDENDNFFDELYQSYHIDRVFAKRMINSCGSNRGAVKELLISN